jgi:hypothetical protein
MNIEKISSGLSAPIIKRDRYELSDTGYENERLISASEKAIFKS